MSSSEEALCLLDLSSEGADLFLRRTLQATSKILYIYFVGSVDDQPSTALFSSIARMYDITAIERPVLQVVPLLDFAGWMTGKAAGIRHLRTVYVPKDSKNAAALAKLLLDERPSNLPALSLVHLSNEGEASTPSERSAVRIVGHASQRQLEFDRVAVGGTFDRLHAGHRSLLSIAALAARSSLFIGVTGDKLLANKKHKEVLQPYEDRERAASDFVQRVRPGLEVVTGPLLDPKARTQAAADPEMGALVLSEETLAGGEAINDDRASQNYRPLTLIVIDLLGAASEELDGQTLSSTALRAKDIAQMSAVATGRAHE